MMLGTIAIAVGGAWAIGWLQGRSHRLSVPTCQATMCDTVQQLAHQSGATGQDCWLSFRAGRPHEFVVTGQVLPMSYIDANRPNALPEFLDMMARRAELELLMLEEETEQEQPFSSVK